jgi:aldose 1-epimerase
MDSPVAIAAGDALLHVAPAIGGAITGFTWRGAPVLRPTAAAAVEAGDVRACGGYPLVPYSNRIRDATLRFEGVRYTLARNFGDHPHAIHGVGWQRAWRIATQAADSIQLVLRHDGAKDPAGWPWSFEARHTLALSTRDTGSCTLHATLTIVSLADAPFPFGLGWHPFFPKVSGSRLRFDASSVWRNDATQLPVALLPVKALASASPGDRSAAAGAPASPREDRFDFSGGRSLRGVVLDSVFNGWNGLARLEQPDMTVAIEADRACGRLVVYAPEGRDFVAIEPVSHETDAFNRAADGTANTGMRVLRPGASFSCTMRLTAAP